MSVGRNPMGHGVGNGKEFELVEFRKSRRRCVSLLDFGDELLWRCEAMQRSEEYMSEMRIGLS